MSAPLVNNAPNPEIARHQSLSIVRESGMCVACGACAHADPSVRLTLDNPWDMFSPDSDGGAIAAAVCPAIEVDFQALQSELFPNQKIGPHGVIDSVFLAQSRDYERNMNASSGGMIKEILQSLLLRDDVDGVIALKQVNGLHFEPTLLREPKEVDELPGSIYHNLSLEKGISLLRENEGRFVFVGIPCQLEGLFNYITKVEPALREKLHTTVGIICGWNYSHHALRAICELKGVSYDAIEDISYRGGGPVGKLRILADGETTTVNRRVDFSYQVSFDRSFNIRRCHVCVNHTNFLADIVVGDAWLPSTVGTKTGISIVVCRRPDTSEFVRGLEEKERIELTEVGADEITESQSANITFGNFAYAYADYLKEEGEHCPEMLGPNRVAAKLASKDSVSAFHKNNETKLALQQGRRYRALWFRKLTVEFGPFAMKYIRWFFVRVIKIKSLLGMREEIAAEKLEKFR